MKIVFLHHANVCKGGIERMLAMKANLLVEQYGYDVVLLTYEQNDAPFPYPLSPKVRCVDLGARQYPAYRWPYPMMMLLAAIAMLVHPETIASSPLFFQAKIGRASCRERV